MAEKAHTKYGSDRIFNANETKFGYTFGGEMKYFHILTVRLMVWKSIGDKTFGSKFLRKIEAKCLISDCLLNMILTAADKQLA